MGLIQLHGRLGRRGRSLLVVALAVAVVPTSAIAVAAFSTERAQLGAAWERPSPAVLTGMRWARDHSPRRAAFVDATLALDLPVHARRGVMSGGPRWEQNWRYPERALRLRRDAVAQLGVLQPCSDEVREFLIGLGRPIYVVLRRDPGAETDAAWRDRLALAHPGYRRAAANSEIAFYQWTPWP
jgi:hypothetical protein